jgi:hypothetical protein
MNIVDDQLDMGYTSTEQEGINVADVLENLRAELARQEVIFADSKHAIRQLRAAIDAVERVRALSNPDGEHQHHLKIRGYLIDGIIDALRDGIGAVGPIVQHLERQGIKTTKASVSNTLNRLQSKKQVRHDQKKQLWFLTEPENNAGHTNGASHSPLMNSAPDGNPGPKNR